MAHEMNDGETKRLRYFESELSFDGDQVVRLLKLSISEENMRVLTGMYAALESTAPHADVISKWFMTFDEIAVIQDGVLQAVETVHVSIYQDGECSFEVEIPDGPRCESAGVLSLRNEQGGAR
jgi:hypothetical protein